METNTNRIVMLSLIGEQSIPNLLPIRYYNPEQVVLVHTDLTAQVSERLSNLCPGAITLSVHPYDIAETESRLDAWVQTGTLDGRELLINLTGGTKPMMLAAYRLAEKQKCAFVYLQTEGRQSLIYRYTFVDGQPILDGSKILPGLISIEEYLGAHVLRFGIKGFSQSTGGVFEEAIYGALDEHVDQVIAGVTLGGAVDADLVIRVGNRIGVVEAKTGASARKKSGIDQLNTLGGRAYLGTYASKFLVIDQRWTDNQSDLRELAMARHITVVELPSFGTTGHIAPEDRQRLIAAVREKL